MFTGSIVALITPMNNNGVIDYSSLKKLINYHIISGTSAIVIAGTTGEGSTMTHNEHYDIIMRSLEIANNRIPIISGTGSNSTHETILLTNRLNNTGIAGCLTIVPYYSQPTQEGIYQHFLAVANSTDLPQIIYNIPTRTGCDIIPTTVARLAKINNIIGIKEASGHLSRVNQIRYLVDKKFILLSGQDSTALDFIQLGGNGVISVAANLVAQEMAQIAKLAINRHFIEAHHLNKRLIPLYQTLFLESNPIPVKWACKQLKLIEYDTLRLPMTSLTQNSMYILEQVMNDIGLL